MSIFLLLAAQATLSVPAIPPLAAEQDPPCFVGAEGPEGSERTVRASCRGYGLTLGRADSYTVVQNFALGSTMVDLRRGSDRQVLMISFPGSDGPPLIEDITGSLASAAGRGPMGSLAGLDIDLGTFATDGSVAVSSTADGTVEAAKSGTVNLGLQMAAEKTRASAVAVSAQN